LGSTTRYVIDHAWCNVLIVKWHHFLFAWSIIFDDIALKC
jgi:hypothetical protein